MCYSGYTTASWGHYHVCTSDRIPFNYIPKEDLYVDADFIHRAMKNKYATEDYNSPWMKVFCDYGDTYYPCGYVSVDLDFFVKAQRAMEKRPVWIFYGESASGKSTIASLLQYKSVYETDSSDMLPDVIDTDVVVIGNKYKYSIEDVKRALWGDPQVILVKFNKD